MTHRKKHYKARLVLIPIFVACLFMATPLSVFAVETPEAKKINDKENEINQSVERCKQNVDTKAAVGFNQIDNCDCTDDTRQANKATLKRLAEKEKVKCRLNGIGKKLDYIEQERKSKIEALKFLRDQYKAQSDSYMAWHAEITKHWKDAIKKVTEESLNLIAGLLLEGTESQVTEKIDNLINNVDKYKDIRKVKRRELKAFVNGVRKELKGKSREDAKMIIKDRLELLRSWTEDVVTITEADTDQKIANAISDIETSSADDSLQGKYEAAYNLIMTSSEMISNHGGKVLLNLSEGSLGIIALAPDAFDAGITLWTVLVDSANISALDGLREASNLKFQGISQDIYDIVKRKKELENERKLLN